MKKAPEDFTMDELVSQFVMIRDHRSALEKQKVSAKEKMDKIGFEIQKRAIAQGVTSFATPAGTAYQNTKEYAVVLDWDKALEYILANDLKHMLPKSVKKAALKEFMEENDGLKPDGLDMGSKTETAVRRN